MHKIDYIREEEKKYHEHCYDNYKLFVPNQFDVIIAVSSLEHVRSKETLKKVLLDMAVGTKSDGINCIIINTNVKETDLLTNQTLEPLIEVNMTTEQGWDLLDNVYVDWEQINSNVKPLEFEINRDGKPVSLSSDCITLVVKKRPE